MLCHLGPLPDYIGLFLDSAGYNSQTDFLIVTDQEPWTDVSRNVRWHQLVDGEAEVMQRFRNELTTRLRL